MIRSPEETDQNNLPDLLTSDNFRVCLKKTVQKKLEQLDWILKSNFKDEIDYADGVDFVFTTDDKLKTNFRKSLYPEYKAQRKLVKKSYNIFKIHQYIINKRIASAQNLLREGKSPGEAARMCGFNDYAGFYRAFVKQTGMAPQIFSKRQQQPQKEDKMRNF